MNRQQATRNWQPAMRADPLPVACCLLPVACCPPGVVRVSLRLFSNPDYPLFLIAVFFLYALSRFGGARGRWARIAVMLLLGDLVFVLISKDPDTLWDPLGNILLRLAAHTDASWPIATLASHWAVGLVVIGGAITLGMRAGGWIACDARPARDRAGAWSRCSPRSR